MATIQLVNGGVAIVDDADLPLVSGRAWRASFRYRDGRRAGVSRVVSGTVKHGTFAVLHRVITNCPDGLVVDHSDGDPLNNRRQNLRVCTNMENLRNRKRASSNKCGYKGVYRDGKSFRAEIKANKKRYCLGTFQTAKQAHEAYVAAAERLHGEFARAA